MQFVQRKSGKARAALVPLLAILFLGAPAAAQDAVPERAAPPAEAQAAPAAAQDAVPERAAPPAEAQAAPAAEPEGASALPASAADAPATEAGGTEQDLKSLSLEELMEIEVGTVVSASKYRQKVSDAPASVSIVTAEDIKRYGHRTLADILRSVGGLYTTYDRNYHYAGIRGFGRPGDYNTRVLLLVDGHRVNETIYSSAAVGTDFILDVDLIERVEVTRGPGSSLYGSNAFFGVVNVITRRAAVRSGAELSAEAASFGTSKGRLTYGTRMDNGSEALLSATGYTSAGDSHYYSVYDPASQFPDPRAANNGIADNVDGDRFLSAYGSFSSGGFRLAAAGVDRTKIVPTGSYGTDFNDPGNYTKDQRAYIDAQYSRRSGGDTEYMVRGYADLYRFSSAYMYGGAGDPDDAYGTWYGGEARAVGRVLDIHRVIIGAEGELQERQDQWHAGWEDRRRSGSWALYVQDEVSVSSIFLLYAGVRHDHSSIYGGSTNPRLSAVIKPVEKGTLKLMYGTAYRAPSVYEKWYEYQATILSNPGLKPETIDTYELAYEHDFGRGLRASLGRYSYGIKNLITQVDNGGTLQYQNIDRVDAVGTEVEVQKAWAGGTQGRLSYAYQKAENPTSGALLTNSPKHLAKFNLTVPLAADRLFAGFEEQYTGPRFTEAGQKAAGFYLTNLTLLGRNRTRTVEASLTVYNLLDERYADPVSADLVPLDTVQQDGRTVRAKLTYAF